jgi:transcriptional regulator with XRE-family HTH domain
MPAKKSAASQALGKAVRSTRSEQGYSQEGFARHAGMDRSYFGAIERGEFSPTLDMLVKIATALGMSLSELLRRATL